MQSKAATVADYLASLPADRRAAIAQVRTVILANLDKDYEEGMSYGMIGYCVPHRVFPDGYHCDPKLGLPFAALASQKNYMSVYLMGIYDSPTSDEATWFREAWAKAGKKLDMGKCCVRFKKVEDLALDVLAEAIRRMPARKFVQSYVAAREQMGTAGQASARRVKKVTAAKGKAAKGKPAKIVRKPAGRTKAKAR